MKKKLIGIFSVIIFSLVLAVSAKAMVVTNHGITLKYLKDRSSGRVVYGQFLNTANGRFAYCLHNNKHSPRGQDLPEGRILTDEVYTALTVGYPNRSYTGNAQKDYYATQVVIRCLIGEFNINNLEENPGWNQDGVMSAVRSIYNQATGAMQHQEASINVSQSSVGADLSGDYYLTPVLNTTVNNVREGMLSLELHGAPSGTILVNADGYYIDRVGIGQPFRVAIPKSNTSGSFTFNLSGEFTKSIAQVYCATEENMQDVVSLQDKRYGVKSPNVAVNWNDTGSLQIAKRDAETHELVGYAKFHVTGPGFDQYINIPAEGYYNFWALPTGSYTITEVDPPGGYLLGSERTQTVNVTRGQMTYTNFNNFKRKANIDLYKTDKNTGKPLAGATYRFYQKSDKSRYWDYTTDSTGYIHISNWWFDTYTYKEINPPKGYFIDNTERELTLNERKTYQLHTTNTRAAGSLKLIKTDYKGKPLANAEFKIVGPSGFNRTVSTNAKGLVNLNDLDYGDYTIEEAKAPTGYIKDGKSEQIRINRNTEYSITFKNNIVHATVRLVKLDTETNKPLEGATLVVKKDGKLITKVTTDKTGFVELNNVEYGEYTVEEVSAPQGYVLNTSPVKFKVEHQGQIIKVPIPNTKKRGNITIVKKDNEKQPVQGAEFIIKDSSGKVLHKVTTDKVGVASGGNLPWGTYTVEESKAPAGYIRDDKTKTARIWFGIPQTVEFTNIHIKAKLEVIKQDNKTSEKLKGAEFKITGPNSFTKTVTTGKDGKVILENLYYGDYKVIETKAPDGYDLNTTERSFKVSENSKLYSLTFTNIKHSESLVLHKVDQNGKPICGAKFTVKEKHSSNEVAKVVTDKSGNANISNIPFGDYVVEETDAPIGYLKDAKAQELHIGMAKVGDLNFKDTKICGNLHIKKIDEETKKPLKGAKYQIKGPNGFFKECVTNDKGEIVLSGLEYGDYSLVEVEAPKDFILDKTTHTVSIREHNKDYVETYSNKLKGSSINIIKVDDKGHSLSKVKFQLLDKVSNKVLKEGLTDDSGLLSFTDLRRGDYVVKEVEIPKSYLNKTPEIDVKITWYQSIDKTVVNHKIRGDIKITKTDDETHKPLSGARFRILSGGHIVREVTTDAKGEALLKSLDYGEYTVKEIEAPKDYNLNPKETKVNITEDGKIYPVDYSNHMKDCSITINKKNEVDNKLEGAKFQLIDKKTGKVLQEKITNNLGELSFKGLRRGIYTIKEKEAPKGHLPISSDLEIVIDRHEDITKNLVDNRIKGDLEITKEDVETHEPLQGAKFEIKKNGALVKTVVTDKDGKAKIKDLIYGSYSVQEIEAPSDYELDNTPQTFDLTENGKLYKLKYSDRMKDCSISVHKLNEINEKLQGAKFELLDKSGKSLQTLETDKDGNIVFKGLRRGDYTVREVNPPVGHIKNKSDYPVGIHKYESPELTVLNTRIRGDIRILKIDSETQKPLKGAKFKVIQDGKPVCELVTDTSGECTLTKQLYGSYAIQEVEPPKNYELNSELKSVKISENGKVYSLTYANRLKDCSIHVHKENEIGNSLEGVEFSLLNKKDNKVLQTALTDNKGNIIFKGLRRGTYLVKENKIPRGHVNESTVKEIIIDEYENPSITLINTRIRGNIRIIKVDAEDKHRLSKAEFGLFLEGKEVARQLSNEKGEVTFTNLLYDNYEVKELKAPEGHLLNKQVYKVFVEKDRYTYTLEIPNERIKGDVELTKTDSELGTAISNTEFSIFRNGKKLHTLTTNEGGYVKSPKLDYGYYNLVETKPREDYNPNPKSYTFNITQHNKTLKYDITNNVIKGSIRIIKVDSLNGKPVSNVKFGLYQNSTKDKPLRTVITDKSGITEIPSLRYGTYIVKELEVPNNYILSSQEYKVNINENGKIYILNIENEPVLSQVELTKKDDLTGKGLQGAVFNLYHEGSIVSLSKMSGDKIEGIKDFISDSDGKIKLPEKLRCGKYTLVEAKAPTGFKIVKPIDFDVHKDIEGNRSIDINLDAVDASIKGTVILTKTDDKTDTKLPGVKFKMVRVKGVEEPKEVGEFTTDKNGKIEIKNLTYGDYYFEEVKTLDNYVLDTNKIPFSILEDGKVIETSKKNMKLKGNIHITKVDSETGKAIQGTSFSLFKGNEKVTDGITGLDGTVDFKDLLYGKYSIKETKPSKGYQNNKEEYPVFISKDGDTIDVKIKNTPIKARVELKKLDARNRIALKGATFEIFNKNKQSICKGTTNSEGKCLFNLNYGEYYYKEIKAPCNYIPDKSLHKFTVNENGKVYKIEVLNQLKEGNVLVHKQDVDTKQPLEGTKFALYRNIKPEAPNDSETTISPNTVEHTNEPNSKPMTETSLAKEYTLVAKGKTDKSGNLMFKEVEVGDYIVKEIEPPKDYSLGKGEYKIKVDSNESFKTVIFENKKKETIVKTGNVTTPIAISLISTCILGSLIYFKRK